MKCRLPIYVHADKDLESGNMGYVCAPLFEDEPRCFDVNLSRAMSKLAKRYKPILDRSGELLRHDALFRAINNPELDTKILRLRLDLVAEIVRTRLLFVVMPMFERWIAFTPSLPDVWFELDSVSELELRATEVLTDYYRRELREARRNNLPFYVPTLSGQAWVATMDVDVATPQRFTPKDLNPFAALWDEAKVNGSVELNRVGRCLDWMYPDGLKHAVLREDEVEQLGAALASDAYRPIALIGPRLCGKTSIIHEYVRRIVSKRPSPFSGKYWHWRISPQRLISGMSYVGQWESRLLAILKETRRRGHVLVFDNFLGLFEAGKSSCSNLSVADVLRASILRRQVRVVTEMNMDEWSALQERDRGLADQFQIIRVDATNDNDTLRILLKERRELEHEFRCCFALDAMPAIVEIHRRYVRSAAFPGKAAGFMRRIAAKSQQADIDAAAVYREFSHATGVAYGLLNSESAMLRETTERQLQAQIVGQPDGVDAAADAVMLAKAGLNDPDKPIATLLFLGPTGVGKTQCAKALAETMFSDASRLIRFDMNEYGGYAGAARLIGSRQDPDGLLTAAVRRQPYAVILLDEIEKAHRDVFDLLLQVLGEGRLTDSRGRTADFTNTVIVMTSNLGVRDVGRTMGLGAVRADQTHAYEKAARRFFRPEFFNRIDRIVPFSPLTKDNMRRILEMALSDLLDREGLVSRRAAVRIDTDALEYLVQRGYHPKLGARALKRTVESELGQPIARQLAKLNRDAATLLVVDLRDGKLDAQVRPFVDVPRRSPPAVAPENLIERLERFCDRIRGKLDSIRPEGGVSAGDLTREQLGYFSIQEQLQNLHSAIDVLKQHRRKASAGAVHLPSPPSRRLTARVDRHTRESKGELRAAHDIAEFHQDAASESQPELDREKAVTHAIRLSSYLQSMWASRDEPDRALLVLRPMVRFESTALGFFQSMMRAAFEANFGYDFEVIRTNGEYGVGKLPVVGTVYAIGGVGVWPLLKREEGTHMFQQRGGRLTPHSVDIIPCSAGREMDALVRFELERGEREWLASRGDPALQDVFDPQPVVRHYRFGNDIYDSRTGKTEMWSLGREALAEWILDSLDPPTEILADADSSAKAE